MAIGFSGGYKLGYLEKSTELPQVASKIIFIT
jgi:hypothetical protein